MAKEEQEETWSLEDKIGEISIKIVALHLKD